MQREEESETTDSSVFERWLHHALPNPLDDSFPQFHGATVDSSSTASQPFAPPFAPVVEAISPRSILTACFRFRLR